jgi:glycosyltransferase involved in cell wall biosynthesis
MHRMKVLISAAGPLDGQVGGGQVYVQKLATELSRRPGREVVVVATEAWAGCPPDGNDGNDALTRIRWRQWNDIPVATVSVHPAASRAGERWSERPRPLLAALDRIVAEARPDIIHLNGLKPALVSVALDRAVPHVVTAHHGGVACPAGTLLRPDDTICDRPMDHAACGKCYCRQLRGGGGGSGAARSLLAAMPSFVYRPLGRALDRVPNATYAGRALMYPWLVSRAVDGKRFALTHAEHWIAPSRAIAAVLARNRTPPQRISVVPHGIEPLPRRPIEGLSRRAVRFGYVGQINRPKGLAVLFAAFAQLPRGSAELHIVGQPQRGGEREYLQAAMATCAGSDFVHLRGAVPHNRIGDVLGELDVLVLPAIYLEVFGLVVLEAFSAGRPVIVSDCGGPAELVRDGLDGLVVPPNNADALARAMRRLVEDPQLILEMAVNIRPVRTLAEHVADLELIYDQILARHDGAPAFQG